MSRPSLSPSPKGDRTVMPADDDPVRCAKSPFAFSREAFRLRMDIVKLPAAVEFRRRGTWNGDPCLLVAASLLCCFEVRCLGAGY